jgi:hypothetical protein
MHAYTLTPEDLAAIEPVVAELTKTYEEIEDPELIRRPGCLRPGCRSRCSTSLRSFGSPSRMRSA